MTVLQGMSTQVIKRALEQSMAKQHAIAEAAQKGAAGAEAAPPDEGSGSADGGHGAGASASAAVVAEAAAPAPTAAASAQPRSSAGDTSTPQNAKPQPQGCAEGKQVSPGSHSKVLSGVRTCRPAGCTLPDLLFSKHVLRCGCRHATLYTKPEVLNPASDAVAVGAPADEGGEEEAQRRALAHTACAVNVDVDTLERALGSAGLLEFADGLSQAEWSDWLSALQPFQDAAGAKPLNVSWSPCADPGESCRSSRVHSEQEGAPACVPVMQLPTVMHVCEVLSSS